MTHKQAPRRGARSRATARPIPADDAPPTERRSKRRHNPAEQPGPSSASPSSAKRGRTSSSRGRGSENPRRRILVSSPDVSEASSSSSSSDAIPSKSINEGKIILKPRAVDLADTQLVAAFPEIHSFFSFQTWLPFISEFRVIYPRLVQEFYMNLECTDDCYKSEVKDVVIDMPTALAATLFKIPDEGADYHNFEFNLHEAYTMLTGLQADESDPKQTHVTKFNTNTFPPVLRLIHHILTTIITPQGGGRDRLTDIQRFVIFCMKKNIKVNLHVIMYQIISETTRKDLNRSLPYAAHLTQVFKHFGVSLVNEKSQAIPKFNIYCFKHVQKFIGFRLEGDQVRRGPAVVEAPVVPEDQPPAQEDQPPVNEDQPHVENEVDVPLNAPFSHKFQPSSSLNPDIEIPSFSPQPQVQASTSFGGPSVPPELLIGTLADASIELKEHQETLETVLQEILANSQADVFNTKETLSQITKTKLSFAHFVDDLESMKNLSAHIDEEMSDLKKEFKALNIHGGIAGSSSSSQPISDDFRTNIYCKGSVDTPHTGVDTMLQALSQKMKKWSTSVNTRPRQVDTRDRSQRNKSTDFYLRSTLDAVDTELSQVDTRYLSQGTVLPSLGQCVDTPYGQVDTLRKLCDLKLFLDTWHPRELMDWPWIVVEVEVCSVEVVCQSYYLVRGFRHIEVQGIMDQLLGSSPVTHVWRYACEACGLGRDLPVPRAESPSPAGWWEEEERTHAHTSRDRRLKVLFRAYHWQFPRRSPRPSGSRMLKALVTATSSSNTYLKRE
ncbi:hypothetical protein Taro_008879 [Colocasia esculenta]|uniref:Putative plant transposon protein domain-containing protein n=1 Tax=Colocasia esculenta TaxID=4460 RepID=A0A843U369_COLES|nr:hypothetical protein [Colocasia esculenta]